MEFTWGGPEEREKRRLQFGDVQLEVSYFGEGEPLLLLHGEDGLIWSGDLIRELSSRFEVIVPHHPGWGESTTARYVTTVSDIAFIYAEFLEQFKSPITVVGCSFGAWIAAELAVLRPPNLRGLVLAAPIGVKLGSREDRDFADIWIAHFLELPGILYGDPSHAPNLLDYTPADYLYISVAQEGTARYGWNHYMHNPKLRHLLRRIDVPVAVVSGADDHFALLPNYFADYAALIGPSGATHHVVADAGHRIEEEVPKEIARIAFDFIDNIGALNSAGKGAN